MAKKKYITYKEKRKQNSAILSVLRLVVYGLHSVPIPRSPCDRSAATTGRADGALRLFHPTVQSNVGTDWSLFDICQYYICYIYIYICVGATRVDLARTG